MDRDPDHPYDEGRRRRHPAVVPNRSQFDDADEDDDIMDDPSPPSLPSAKHTMTGNSGHGMAYLAPTATVRKLPLDHYPPPPPPPPPRQLAAVPRAADSYMVRPTQVPMFPSSTTTSVSASAAAARQAVNYTLPLPEQPPKKQQKTTKSKKATKAVNQATNNKAEKAATAMRKNDKKQSSAITASMMSRGNNNGHPATSLPKGDNSLFRSRVPDLGPHDILCGPDVGVFPNAGNQFFRRLIRLRQENFRVAKKKVHVQRAIVGFIYDIVTGLTPPGRFKVRGNNMHHHGEWIELGESQAHAFIAASLSEGITGLVRWQPPEFSPRVVNKISGSKDNNVHSVSASKGHKRHLPSNQKTKPAKMPKRSSGDVPQNSRQYPRDHGVEEVIEIDSDSSSSEDNDNDDEPAQRHMDIRLGQSPRQYLPDSSTSPLDHHLLPSALEQRAEALRHISESAAYSSAAAATAGGVQYHPSLAQLRAGMVHPLLGDPAGLAISRLGRVPSTIPTSLLLGTPPTLGGIHHSVAGLSSHGAPGHRLLPTAAHQQLHYGSLGSGSLVGSLGSGSLGGSLRGTSAYNDAQLAAASDARRHLDSYMHHQMDDRGE